MIEVCPGVWRAGTRFVNWYVIDAGSDGLTLIDAGLPQYRKRLGQSLAYLGKTKSDVRALVLTHGHIDHIGMSAELARSGASVHVHPADRPLAADPRRNKSERSVLPYLVWPATAAFVGHCLAQGALRPQPFPESVPLADGAVTEVPGRPVVTHVPGHTEGSCVLEFREHGVVFVGDLLCTASPFSGRRAQPQLQTRGSNRDSGRAMASLAKLEHISAPLVLPGHGGPWRDGIESAVQSARQIGCR